MKLTDSYLQQRLAPQNSSLHEIEDKHRWVTFSTRAQQVGPMSEPLLELFLSECLSTRTAATHNRETTETCELTEQQRESSHFHPDLLHTDTDLQPTPSLLHFFILSCPSAGRSAFTLLYFDLLLYYLNYFITCGFKFGDADSVHN